MKKISVLLILFITNVIFAQDLPIIVDINRFLDNSSNTIFDIIYQTPFNSLKYEKTLSGFSADLKVDYSLVFDGEIVTQGDFTNKLTFPNSEMTRSGKLFRDKISFTLPASNYMLHLTFTDMASSAKSSLSKELYILKKDTFISDLEFSSSVVIDTTNYLEKFHRGKQLFFTSSDHIYSKSEVDSLVFYFEAGNVQFPVGILNEEILILKGADTLQVIQSEISCHGKKMEQIRKLAITDMEAGYYNLIVRLEDPVSGAVRTSRDYFSIKIESLNKYRIFVDLEDEIKLLRYLLPTYKTKIWDNLSQDGKLKFINRFWRVNDQDLSSKTNAFFDLIKERVQYSNLNFSSQQPGWKSDRGRVYIRHGEPDDILQGNTGIRTKYAQKKYVIWKYRLETNYTYLFLDIQTNQNYKMIYSNNDPKESNTYQLEDYLGDDFDQELLN